MAEFVVEVAEGAEAGRAVPLIAPIEIGREAGVGFPVEDEQVSRHHARISPSGDGAVVEDLGSTNGTYVNDQPIQGPRMLRPGDRIRVGLTVLGIRGVSDATVVGQVPQVTAVGREVLQPVPEAQLQPPAPDAAGVPAFATEEAEPAFVPRQLVGDDQAESDFQAIARLVDTRVKTQTNVAVFAMLGAAGLALLIFFGVR